MANIRININDKEKLETLGIDNITLESIEDYVNRVGVLKVPTNVLVLLSELRTPNNLYGAYSSYKTILEMASFTKEYSKIVNDIVQTYQRRKDLIYMDVFSKLPIKTFENYVEALDLIIKDDIEDLAAAISGKCNVGLKMAKDFLNVYIYLNSYNGFIFEYLLKQMLNISERYECLEGLQIDGETFISMGSLDKEWGIDMVLKDECTDFIIPLQLKSYTHLCTNRNKLEHTFNNHKDYKRLYSNIEDKETKGNVYFLHYDSSRLKIALCRNLDIDTTIPKSRDLQYRVINKDDLDLVYYDIWEIGNLLDALVEDISYNVYGEVSNVPKMGSNGNDTNLTTITFYKDIDIEKLF